MKKLLLIGATDPNGAGLQADWRVCAQLGVFSCNVVTAVTAQNHTGVSDNGILTAETVRAQMESIDWSQIAAIKIGMLGNAEIIETILPYLNPAIPLILDPVLAASSGGSLLNDEGRIALRSKLLPRTTLLTPNLREAEVLANTPADSPKLVELLAEQLSDQGADAVLITGIFANGEMKVSADYFYDDKHQAWLIASLWPDHENVRGTGCSLATAIAAAMVEGQPLSEAIVIGKATINAAIEKSQKDGTVWQLQRIHWPDCEAHLPYWLDHPTVCNPERAFPSCGSSRLGIYPVVDSADWVRRLVPLGIETIQLRIKQMSPQQAQVQIVEAIQFCADYPVRLFINDYWELAIKHGAYGVHLGQEDLEDADLNRIYDAGLRLGVSTHCYREVSRALAIGPSYLALGPIYPTTSKRMPWIPQGVPAVERWVSMLDQKRPLVAIGGIDLSRARELASTGVGSVAMISAITEAPDPEFAARELLDLWKQTGV